MKNSKIEELLVVNKIGYIMKSLIWKENILTSLDGTIPYLYLYTLYITGSPHKFFTLKSLDPLSFLVPSQNDNCIKSVQ